MERLRELETSSFRWEGVCPPARSLSLWPPRMAPQPLYGAAAILTATFTSFATLRPSQTIVFESSRLAIINDDFDYPDDVASCSVKTARSDLQRLAEGSAINQSWMVRMFGTPDSMHNVTDACSLVATHSSVQQAAADAAANQTWLGWLVEGQAASLEDELLATMAAERAKMQVQMEAAQREAALLWTGSILYSAFCILWAVVTVCFKRGAFCFSQSRHAPTLHGKTAWYPYLDPVELPHEQIPLATATGATGQKQRSPPQSPMLKEAAGEEGWPLIEAAGEKGGLLLPSNASPPVHDEAVAPPTPSTPNRIYGEPLDPVHELALDSCEQWETAAELIRTSSIEKLTAVQERDAAIEDKHAAIEQHRAAIAERDAAIAEKEWAIEQRDAALSAKEAAIEQRNMALSEKQARVADCEQRRAAIAERDAAIAEKEWAIEQRDAALSAKEAAIEQRNMALSEKQAGVADCEAFCEANLSRNRQLLSTVSAELSSAVNARDAAVTAMESAVKEWDAVAAQRDSARSARDSTLLERDALRSEHDMMKAERAQILSDVERLEHALSRAEVSKAEQALVVQELRTALVAAKQQAEVAMADRIAAVSTAAQTSTAEQALVVQELRTTIVAAKQQVEVAMTARDAAVNSATRATMKALDTEAVVTVLMSALAAADEEVANSVEWISECKEPPPSIIAARKRMTTARQKQLEKQARHTACVWTLAAEEAIRIQETAPAGVRISSGYSDDDDRASPTPMPTPTQFKLRLAGPPEEAPTSAPPDVGRLISAFGGGKPPTKSWPKARLALSFPKAAASALSAPIVRRRSLSPRRTSQSEALTPGTTISTETSGTL